MLVSVSAFIYTVHFAQGGLTLPVQIPLTRLNRPMNGDLDILNGLEGNVNSSHATAKAISKAACCSEGSRSATTLWTPSVLLVRSLDRCMGPGNGAECAGESATGCKVVPSIRSKETKTESRGNRIRECGAGWRAGAAEDTDLCRHSGGGLRDSSGQPCVQGVFVFTE